MPSKPKTSRRQYSKESIAVILKLHSLGYSSLKISVKTDVLKSTVTRIIKQADLYLNISVQPVKRPGRPFKLNRRAERVLLRHVVKYPKETLVLLSIPIKSGYQLHPNITRRYLKKNEVYAFRSRRKSFLSKKHKRARLKWAKEYVYWTEENWACVDFSDECIMEIGIDVTFLWVRRPKGKAFEF